MEGRIIEVLLYVVIATSVATVISTDTALGYAVIEVTVTATEQVHVFNLRTFLLACDSRFLQ